MLLRNTKQCLMASHTIINQNMVLGSWYIIVVVSGQVHCCVPKRGVPSQQSLVMRGGPILLCLWVLHVTGFSPAVGFNLALVLTQLFLENQFLYLLLNKAFLQQTFNVRAEVRPVSNFFWNHQFEHIFYKFYPKTNRFSSLVIKPLRKFFSEDIFQHLQVFGTNWDSK